MLNLDAVKEKEESLRIKINTLPEVKRKEFFLKVKDEIKDPDTYATLNWFFIAGIHHFYLGKWLNGIIDLFVFIIGIILIIINYTEIGISLILIISVIELWALFRSQLIIQDWNNQIYERVFNSIKTD